MVIAGVRIPMAWALLFWAAVWEFVGRTESVFIITPLSDVLSKLIEILPKGNFHEAMIITGITFGVGMLFAIVFGVAMGFIMGLNKTANGLLGMWVNIFAAAPLSSLVPVLILLFGFDMKTIIITVVLFSIWIIALDTYAGVRHVSPSLLEMGRSFGATRWQICYKIIFLAALPEILAGIRMGFIRAVKGVVIGQLLISVVGIGQLFRIYIRSFLMSEFWALALVLFVVALGMAAIIGKLEKSIEYYASARTE